jgi:hypothetical protein
MSEITDQMRGFMVRRFACFESTSEVKQAVEDEYGVILSTRDVARHNPTLTAAENLGDNWHELFWAVRRNFEAALDDIGIVHKVYRLQKLDQMERKARKDGDFEMSMKMLRQAAEEIGGAFEKNKGGITLATLQKAMDELAQAVVAEVADPDALARIEERWGKIGEQQEAKVRIVS